MTKEHDLGQADKKQLGAADTSQKDNVQSQRNRSTQFKVEEHDERMHEKDEVIETRK